MAEDHPPRFELRAVEPSTTETGRNIDQSPKIVPKLENGLMTAVCHDHLQLLLPEALNPARLFSAEIEPVTGRHAILSDAGLHGQQDAQIQ
jgi:hypothetical protein